VEGYRVFTAPTGTRKKKKGRGSKGSAPILKHGGGGGLWDAQTAVGGWVAKEARGKQRNGGGKGRHWWWEGRKVAKLGEKKSSNVGQKIRRREWGREEAQKEARADWETRVDGKRKDWKKKKKSGTGEKKDVIGDISLKDRHK